MRNGIREVLDASSDRDEEIPRHDTPGVDLQAGEAVDAFVDVAKPFQERGLDPDHAGALNRRSVSRATSRSSKGSFRPAISCPCS